jgi:hypothetical protein
MHAWVPQGQSEVPQQRFQGSHWKEPCCTAFAPWLINGQFIKIAQHQYNYKEAPDCADNQF